MGSIGSKMRRKQGLFFTSVAFIIVIILVLTFSPPKPITLADETQAMEARARMVNEHTKAVVNSYLPLAIRISAYNTFAALAEFLQEKSRQGKGKYFATTELFNLTFSEVMVNGTICCDIQGPPDWPSCDSDVKADVLDRSKHLSIDDCLEKPVMRDKNLSILLKRIENASFVALRVNTSIGGYDLKDARIIELFQDNRTGPWKVGINVSVNYSITVGDISVNNSKNISVLFSIEGIPDPLYPVESWFVDEDGDTVTGAAGDPDERIYTNYFNATNITKWNLSNLYRQADWRLYKHDENASSFLMRFYGMDERSPCCGVESLINPFTMETVNGRVEKPYVDWCYYGGNNRCTSSQAGSMWNVTCMTNPVDQDTEKFYRFAISSYHASQYNATNHLYGLDPDGAGPLPACAETPFP